MIFFTQWILICSLMPSPASISTCRTYIAESTTIKERTTAITLISFSQSLGYIIGPGNTFNINYPNRLFLESWCNIDKIIILSLGWCSGIGSRLRTSRSQVRLRSPLATCHPWARWFTATLLPCPKSLWLNSGLQVRYKKKKIGVSRSPFRSGMHSK